MKKRKKARWKAYLTLDGAGLVITLSGNTAAYTNSTITGLDTSSLGQVLFSLLLANFNLLLLTATTEFIRLELISGLELGATVLGDVTFGHGC